VDQTFSPMIWNGQVFDNVRGRAIGRELASSRDDGHVLVALTAVLAEQVEGDRGARWRSRVRGWLQRDSGTDPRLAEPGAASQRTLSEVMALHRAWSDTTLVPTPEPVRTQAFGAM